MQITRKHNYNISWPIVGSAVFILFCLVFATTNSTIDAYGYAADIKYSENIFRPHHLLYNALGYMLHLIIKDIEPLVLMKGVNAIFALGCLHSLYAILKVLNFNVKYISSAVMVVASSFALLRFATENEVYIIPLFLSLWGTFYYIKYCNSQKVSFVVYSCVLMSMAALFHQMHIIWLLVTAVTFIMGNKRHGFLYLLISGIIILCAYCSVIIYYNNESLSVESITRFVLYDYYTGEAGNAIGLSNFYLTGINFIRSFIQIHGNIYYLIKANLIYAIPIIICIVLLLVQIRKYINTKNTVIHSRISPNKIIKKYILSVFIAHLLFAFYAQGNAEFMVMLPFLLLIYLGLAFEKYMINFLYIGIAIFVWNFGYGLYPQKYEDLQNKKYMTSYYNNKDIYILQQANLYKNMFYYVTHTHCTNIYKTPADYKSKNQSYLFLDSLIKHSNSLILTDAIGNKTIGTRKALLSDDFDAKFFSNYTLIPFYTQSNSLGDYNMMQIENGK